MLIASWNVNSIRARIDHVRTWLATRNPDVLLLQELKATEFPLELFSELGYSSAAVTQKAYNGVAVLSRHPIEVVCSTLIGDDTDSHARFLEVMIRDIRIANIYLPNGNPVGSENFLYKLGWMDRLQQQLQRWLQSEIPTLVGGDFNVIPEDIDCHKPASWAHDALFQPEARTRYRSWLAMGYVDAFRFLHPGEGGCFTFWDYFRKSFEHNRGIRIDHLLLSPSLAKKTGELRGRQSTTSVGKAVRSYAYPSSPTRVTVLRSNSARCLGPSTCSQPAIRSIALHIPLPIAVWSPS